MKILSKITTALLLAGFLAAFTTLTATAQERGNKEARTSPNASVSQTLGTSEMMITYGRPGVKGRTVFGDLVSMGEVWRTGANEATAITLPADVTVEGQSLEAGTYALYTIPNEDSWTIIFNSKQSWGTEYSESEDVLRVDVTPEEAPAQEWFLITFENLSENSADVVLHWNTTKVSFGVEI
jgi:hypothetical protein